MELLQGILTVLQKSTIANHDISDPLQRFWKTYRVTAEEFDNEFLAKYGGDLDASMIFVSLLSPLMNLFA